MMPGTHSMTIVKTASYMAHDLTSFVVNNVLEDSLFHFYAVVS
jgi:hypothetical protein